MYTHKDISLIIPTYNRAKDLQRTLASLKPHLSHIREVLIIDQSSQDDTKKLITKIKKKNIHYYYSSTPSITIARNLGVKKAAKQSRLICFLDDDVTLGKNYFDEILNVFNTHSKAKAVAAYVLSTEKLPSKIENRIRKIFFISHTTENEAKIISAYGNTYPDHLDTTINAQWLPGVNMVYKKDVFKEQSFDENLLGYTVAEDIDFSYRLYKKNPQGLFITPHAKLIHRISTIERYPTEKISYINQVDHFYFYFKNLHSNVLERVKFIWSLLGITLLRTLQYLTTFSTKDKLKLKFYLASLGYCIKNIKEIKEGNLRNFFH